MINLEEYSKNADELCKRLNVIGGSLWHFKVRTRFKTAWNENNE